MASDRMKTSTGESTRRRECFDEVADLYDKARPAYPDALVRDLIEAADLRAGSRVLEIGCGTGQLTVSLAQCDVTLVAIELGANLAAIAQANLSSFERVAIHTGDFDIWPLPVEPFDLVVAATAFHWLNPATRIQKCAHALRSGGMLAIIDTHWGVGAKRDEFSVESQRCYALWDPCHDASFVPRTLSELPDKRDELDASEEFQSTRVKRYPVERCYSAEEYCDLLRTFSDVRALGEENRAGFLGCMQSLIGARFGGRIVRCNAYELWTARNAT